MTLEPTRSVAALIAHAREVPAAERSAFAARLKGGLRPGSLLLETCHRAEAYTVADSDAVAAWAGSVSPPEGTELLVGDPAIRHAIAVTVGADSVVDGEEQVLHQVRTVVADARGARALDPTLDRLFSHALRAGRLARSWRNGPAPSLADLALSAVEHRIGRVRGRHLLVVGAGAMGGLSARAAAAAGADLSLASRSSGSVEALARSTRGSVVPFDPGTAIGSFDAIVVALAGPWPIARETVEALSESRTLVVDLSQPAAIPPSAAEALHDRLLTVDGLARLDMRTGLADGRWRHRADALIDRTAGEFLAWQANGSSRTTAGMLVEQAEREREAELAALWRRLPTLGPEDRAAIEAMARHLSDRLLRAPLERLGRDVDGRGEQAVRDVFAL